MFVGHYGVSFAARAADKRVPLWVWFVAVQWMDVVWSILVLGGVEKLRITPGFTRANALDLYFMPYTHGLPGSIVLSVALGAIVALFTPGRRGLTVVLIAGASFSHWLLDLIVHVPDLPLYGDTLKVGLGLWRHFYVSFPLELLVLVCGAWLYARAAMFATPARRHIFWGLLRCLRSLRDSPISAHRPDRPMRWP